MGLAVRFYLFSDDGLLRISRRLMEGLARGKDARPQYAGTKQRYYDANATSHLNGPAPRFRRGDDHAESRDTFKASDAQPYSASR
jgi:hypothetical protein